MKQELKQRSASLNRLGYSSLRDLRQVKKTRIIQGSLNKLKSMRSTYEQQFYETKEEPTSQDRDE